VPTKTRKAQYAASQTVTFAFIVSLCLGTAGFFFVEEFLALLGAAPDVLPGATAYLEVMSLGLFAMFGFFVFIALMRGAGDTITPMLVMLGTVVFNVILDPFLIFGWWVFPELGVQGAAIATIFSRGLAMVVGLWIMLRATAACGSGPRRWCRTRPTSGSWSASGSRHPSRAPAAPSRSS